MVIAYYNGVPYSAFAKQFFGPVPLAVRSEVHVFIPWKL
jgi:hypothetical protein